MEIAWLFSWGSIAATVLAVAVSLFAVYGSSWWLVWLRTFHLIVAAFSIPVEYTPTLVIVFFTTAFCFYWFGYWICFLEIGTEPADTAEDSQPTFIGKSYRGDPGEPVKMALILRQDLNLTPGKVATQCGHASVGIYRRLFRTSAGLIKAWEEHGQGKIILQVPDDAGIVAAQQRAKKLGVPTYVVRDAAARLVKDNVELGNRTTLACLGPVSLLGEALGSLDPYI